MPAILTVLLHQYPPSPTGFGVNDCVRDLAEHFAAAEDSWRSILLHAYAMATRVQIEYGGIAGASRALMISAERLNYMKQLASVRGVGGAARKFSNAQTDIDLDEREFTWLRASIAEVLARSS